MDLTDVITPDLENALKEQKEQMNRYYAELIANPYRAQGLIDDIRRQVVSTAAVLMENRIPLTVPKKERTLTDVLQEAAAEAGMMMGSNAVAAGVSFFRNVKDKVNQSAQPISEEEFIIYEDEYGNFFFIDDKATRSIATNLGTPEDDEIDDEYDMTDDEEAGDAQWTSLDPSERKELLKNVFSDENWYDGMAFHEGGASHPPFDEIASRVGAEQSTIKSTTSHGSRLAVSMLKTSRPR